MDMITPANFPDFTDPTGKYDLTQWEKFPSMDDGYFHFMMVKFLDWRQIDLPHSWDQDMRDLLEYTRRRKVLNLKAEQKTKQKPKPKRKRKVARNTGNRDNDDDDHNTGSSSGGKKRAAFSSVRTYSTPKEEGKSRNQQLQVQNQQKSTQNQQKPTQNQQKPTQNQQKPTQNQQKLTQNQELPTTSTNFVSSHTAEAWLKDPEKFLAGDFIPLNPSAGTQPIEVVHIDNDSDNDSLSDFLSMAATTNVFNFSSMIQQDSGDEVQFCGFKRAGESDTISSVTKKRARAIPSRHSSMSDDEYEFVIDPLTIERNKEFKKLVNEQVTQVS